MSKQRKTSKQETEAALVARRTKEVALAQALSTPEAKKRLQENGERAKAKAQAAKASGKQAEPKAAAPRERAGEWFFGQTAGPDADVKPLGPFATQIEALEEARRQWPKYAARLTRKLSRFVRIGVWINTAKLQDGKRLKWYATTRQGNEGLFNLPKAASKPAPSEAEKVLDRIAEKITPAAAKKHGLKLYPATIKGRKTMVTIPGADEAPSAKVHTSARIN